MVRTIGIWRSAAFATCAVIATLIIAAPDPDDSLRSAIALHDLGHVIAFGLVTALFSFALPSRYHRGLLSRVQAAGLAASAAIVLGGAVELAQGASGGNADLWDVLRDAGGAFFVAAILVARDPALSVRARAAITVAAFLVLGPFTFPLATALRDEALARTQFPVLASFGAARELSRFRIGKDYDPRLVATFDDEGRPASAVQLTLPPGKYPGIALSHFPGDWRGFRALRLLLVNPDPLPYEMTVRIDDAEYDYKLDLDDRYNRSFVLSPGANRIEIPLADVATAPRGRRFDLARARNLLVFAVDLERPREIVVGPIVLVR
jgi:hypothetical protein